MFENRVRPSSALSAQSVHGAAAERVEVLQVSLQSANGSLCLCRKMLTKDKKPEKEAGKEAAAVIPPRPDTPKMFKAALKVAEQAGIEGPFIKLKKDYKPSDSGAEVRQHHQPS